MSDLEGVDDEDDDDWDPAADQARGRQSPSPRRASTKRAGAAARTTGATPAAKAARQQGEEDEQAHTRQSGRKQSGRQLQYGDGQELQLDRYCAHKITTRIERNLTFLFYLGGRVAQGQGRPDVYLSDHR